VTAGASLSSCRQGSCSSEGEFVSIEPEDDVDVETFVATHAAGGGGKMSRDCCFKCAPSTLKHMSALKDRP
jgi:hypothetical protein